MEPKQTPLGNRVRFLRESSGLVSEDLARAAGLSKAHIRLIESGRRGQYGLHYATARGIASATGCTVEWLIEGIGRPPLKRTVRETAIAALARYHAARDHEKRRVAPAVPS